MARFAPANVFNTGWHRVLDKKNRRNYSVRHALFALDVILLVLTVIALIFLREYIVGIDNMRDGLKLFLEILVITCIVILPIVIFGLLAKAIYKFFPYCRVPQLNKKTVDECTAPLKKFYNIGESYVVTKCYKCSKNELTNKDVLLFVHDGSLRIVNDFTTTYKDFGCYEITKDELEYGYKEENGLTAAYIKCDGMELLLGKRAKPFIDRNVFGKVSR